MSRKPPRQKPFGGVDGEGSAIDGRHEYLHIRGDRSLLITGKPLSSLEVLDFLCSLPTGIEYVSYFFDYDSSMILRGLPPDVVRKVLDRTSRERDNGFGFVPVTYKGFQFDYVPHKELKVRRAMPGHTKTPWVVISDVGSFFQCSFVTALERWGIGSPEQLVMIKENKAIRSTFDALAPETIAYNELECELLADLMESFRRVCEDIGYVPNRWQGPGGLAAVAFEKHGIPKHDTITTVPKEVWVMSQCAFYGGRNEEIGFGPQTGCIVQRDINSAYPWACTHLPCLIHGSWHRTSHPTPGSLYIGRYRFSHDAKSVVCHLPVRVDSGVITWPLRGGGWYWSPEVEAAQAAGTKPTLIGQAWEYRSDCDCKPFGFVEDLYSERIRLGKTGMGLVIKLMLNSLYGKLAQSIGAAPYANPLYASLITALCRARIIADYARIGPDKLIAVATDGVFYALDGPDEYGTGPGLGEWDEIHHKEMFGVQPGVYFLDGKPPKTRGVNQMAVAQREQALRDNWAAGDYGPVDMDVHLFTGIRLAYARNKPDTAGVWTDTSKGLGFEWGTKREQRFMFDSDGHGMRTLPLGGGSVTVPYSKMIGRNIIGSADVDEMTLDEQPQGGW